jgi:SAM-dependent methyltransferase
MQRWNEVFKKEGRVFTEVHEDMPRIAKLFKERAVRRILDLGFGSGRHTVYCAKEGFDVYGIDVAREGLKLTRSWLKQENLAAKLKIGNIYEPLPYLDKFFDAVISVQVMHHARIEDIRKLIKEMERILRSPGFIFVTVLKESHRTFETIAPRTLIPLDGPDKGLIHYIFNEELLRKEFSHFKVDRIWPDETGHYCLLGELKTLT